MAINTKKYLRGYKIFVEQTCKFCGEEFKTIPAEVKRGKGIYCSRDCLWEATGKRQKGTHHSAVTKKKIGKGNSGKIISKKTREKQSQAMTGKMMGKSNPSWRGGKSFEPYSVEFTEGLKEIIRKRDHYRCQECFRHQDELHYKSGSKYKLHIHHIDYNKKNDQENNLIALCHSCHSQTNYGREDWVKYYNSKVN